MAFQRISCHARCLLLAVLVFSGLVGGLVHLPSLYAQDGIERKVKTRVNPIYPDIARRMGITGSVKLQVVIATNGTVKDTKVIGGHPILVNAVLDAVKKWKFETGSEESTGTLEFKFEPGT
ncbi:MAG: energy transducer TonB [Acidobacteria bacterium]|nr:energy transducer TonB [Acidobacteriota bacterium]